MLPNVNLDRQGSWPVIGLTGGIASGKTTATDYYRKKGAVIVDADEIYRHLTQPGSALSKQVQALFRAFDSANGVATQARLASLAFSNPDFRKQLETLTHPVILAEIFKQVKNYLQTSAADPIIISAALLFETGQYQHCKKNILIASTETIQLARLMQREQISREEALQRIQAQLPLHEKQAKANWIIQNNAEKKDFYRALDTLWPDLLKIRNP